MSSIVIAGDTSGSVTLQAPAVSGSSVLSLPAVTDTVAGIAATQTLTNKSIVATQLTGTIAGARLPAGSVLQVVQGTKSGSTFTTSATYATSNVFATITPTLNTSKVMVIASSPCCYQQSGGLRVSLYRGTSGNGSGSEVVEIGNGNLTAHNLGSTVNWLDSPASTSALSYTIMQKSVNGSSLVGFVGDQGGTASILLLEIAA
jgi:hypothetical protein